MQLEILNANKESVVTIVSDKSQLKSTVTEVEDMNLSQTFRYVDAKLEDKEGLNRFNWNLRQKGAWSANKNRSYKNGPMVASGTYTAKLTVNGKTYEQSFEIVMDPRVKATGFSKSDFETQIAMQNKVISLMSEANKLQSELESEVKKAKGNRLEKLKSILKQLKNDKGAYPQQMLVSQISYLYYMISGADQLPGQEAENRYEELVELLDNLKVQVRD